MKCSVVMAVYQEPLEYIKLAIESVLQQSEQEFEFIIVNDAPQRMELAKWLMAYEQRDPRIHILHNSQNSGLVASLNRALAQCQGEYIFRMDADDCSLPMRFTKQLTFMEQHQLDFCATLITIIDEAGQTVRTNRPLKRPLMNQTLNRLLQYRNFLSHPTWCVKRELYEQLAGYRFLVPAEDYDFILRAAQAGYKIGLLNEPLILYRHNNQSISLQNVTKQYLYAYAMQKYYRQNRVYTPTEIERTYQHYCTDPYFAPKELEQYASLKRNGLKKQWRQVIRCLLVHSVARELIFDDLKVIILKALAH